MIDERESLRDPELIVDSLRAQGYRITKAREDIIKIMCNQGHYTVEELVHELKKIKEDVNVATVYNNVNFLVEEGILEEYNFINKSSIYELNIGLHAHLVCIDCSEVYNINIPTFEKIKQKVEKDTGFKIVDAKLDMYGHCGPCLKKESDE